MRSAMNSVIFNKLERLKEEIKYLSDNRRDLMTGLDRLRDEDDCREVGIPLLRNRP